MLWYALGDRDGCTHCHVAKQLTTDDGQSIALVRLSKAAAYIHSTAQQGADENVFCFFEINK